MNTFKFHLFLFLDLIPEAIALHAITNSYESNATNLEHLNIGIDEVDLEETRRKILNEVKSTKGRKAQF